MAVFPAMLSLSSRLPTSHCLSVVISTSLPFAGLKVANQPSSCQQGKELTYGLRRRRQRQHHAHGLSNQGQLGSRSLVIMHHPRPLPGGSLGAHHPVLCGHSWAAEAGPGTMTEVGASTPCHLEPWGDPPLRRSLVGQWRRESVPRVLPLESLLGAPPGSPHPLWDWCSSKFQ